MKQLELLFASVYVCMSIKIWSGDGYVPYGLGMGRLRITGIISKLAGLGNKYAQSATFRAYFRWYVANVLDSRCVRELVFPRGAIVPGTREHLRGARENPHDGTFTGERDALLREACRIWLAAPAHLVRSPDPRGGRECPEHRGPGEIVHHISKDTERVR